MLLGKLCPSVGNIYFKDCTLYHYQRSSKIDLDPIHAVPDTLGHDIEFG